MSSRCSIHGTASSRSATLSQRGSATRTRRCLAVTAAGRIIRPGSDPDQLAAVMDGAVDRFSASGATVVLFTGPDLGFAPVLRVVLDTLQVEHRLNPVQPEPLRPRSWRRARADDLVWAREYLLPWVLRRIRGTSSGDNLPPKGPLPIPVESPADRPRNSSSPPGLSRAAPTRKPRPPRPQPR